MSAAAPPPCAPPPPRATRPAVPTDYAPLWRRIAAAFYDGLLLLALWLSGTLLAVVAQDLLRLPSGAGWQQGLRLYYLMIGLLFFGGCWTHGGQTPGLRAWRLRLQRDDGATLRWPVAAVRYLAMLVSWIIALLPLLALIPALRGHFPGLATAGAVAVVALAAGLLWTRLDARRRSPQDHLASTVTVLVRTPST